MGIFSGLFRSRDKPTNATSGSTSGKAVTERSAMDSGSASWIEEDAAIQESDVSFAQETLSAYKLGCISKGTMSGSSPASMPMCKTAI